MAGVAGQVAAEGEGQSGDDCGGAAGGELADEEVGEDRGQPEMGDGLDLQGEEGEAPGRGQQDGQQAGRVEHGRLDVGPEGRAGKGVGIPQGQPADAQLPDLEGGEGPELGAEIAGGEGLPVGQVGRQDGPEEQGHQDTKEQNNQPIKAGPGFQRGYPII